MRFSTLAALFFALSLSWVAFGDGEEIDVSPLEKKYWALCDESGGVVQNRLYPRRERFEISLFGGKDFGSPFLDTYPTGATLGFHYSEFLSLHAIAWLNTNSRSDLVAPQIAASINTNRAKHYLGGEARASLFYGKFNLAGLQIPRFDTYLSAGAGSMATESGHDFTLTAGIGQQFHLSRHFALNLDFKLVGYREAILEKRVAQKTFVGQKLEDRTHLTGMVTFGISVFFDAFDHNERPCELPSPEKGFTFPVDPVVSEAHVEADESMVETRAEVQATSDELSDRLLRVTYNSHRRDPFWEYPEEARQSFDLGLGAELHDGSASSLGFFGTKAWASAGTKFSPNAQAKVALGGHRLENRATQTSKDLMTAELNTSVSPSKTVHLNLIANYDYVYTDLILPGAVTDFITARSLYLHGHFWPDAPIRLSTHSSLRYFSDTNVRKAADAGLMYGLSRGVPWIWLGVGAEYLGYDQRRTNYWTPTRFIGLGPRFEAESPIHGNFSGSLALNLSTFQEDDFPWAFGYYATAKIRYGLRETLHLDFGYTRIQSLRNATTWYSDSLFMEMGTSF